MKSTKLLLLILFVVVLLFVVSLNLGTFQDDLHLQQPDWPNAMGNVLARPAPLTGADLLPSVASCLQQDKVIAQQGTTCTFTVKKSVYALRVVKAQLIQGKSASIALTQEDVLRVQKELVAPQAIGDDDLKIYPNKAQGVLTFTCIDANGTGTCQFELIH